VIVFDISAMNRTAISTVKSVLRRRAEEMIQTVVISYDALDELSQRSKDSLKSLQSSDVSAEIGNPAHADVIFVHHSFTYSFIYSYSCGTS